jgi:iron(III) transport system permease protein
LWGQLSALGIMMIFISTALVILATIVGMKFKPVEEGG